MNKNLISFLIADDDHDDQELITEALYSVGGAVSVATVDNGEQVLDFLTCQGKFKVSRPSRPAVIILDVNMPLLNGMEVCKRIKMLDEIRNIPVFMWTTSTDSELHSKCLSLGAERIYSKPSAIVDLQAIAEEIYHLSCERSHPGMLASA
jgi:two-component system response regulator